MSVRLAGCVIANSKNEILLIHRNNGKFNHWELPGGKVEVGEEEEATAIRELHEELGVKVKVIKYLGMTEFTDSNGEFIYTWFLGEIIEGNPGVKEPDVFDNFGYFSIDRLGKLKLSGNMLNLFPKLLAREIILD